MIMVLGNDKNNAYTRLNITNLKTGRQHKKICYTSKELEFERSHYSDSKLWHVTEWRYEPCDDLKTAL
ncbi:MAG: hypothetical protein RR603_00090 [Kurthia sp.]